MGTRSGIIVKIGKSYQGIYCHWDGYPDGVGKTLKEHYTDPRQNSGANWAWRYFLARRAGSAETRGTPFFSKSRKWSYKRLWPRPWRIWVQIANRNSRDNQTDFNWVQRGISLRLGWEEVEDFLRRAK